MFYRRPRKGLEGRAIPEGYGAFAAAQRMERSGTPQSPVSGISAGTAEIPEMRPKKYGPFPRLD
jgi:hypothetical protein